MEISKPVGASLNLSELLTFHETPMVRESQPSCARNFRISLKQWKMFHAVVDFDGFTGAASHLHISQSAISYTLAKLQEQLGVSLLTLKGRKAQITEEGKILLECSRDLVKNAIELESLAENLRQGWGPEIRLAVDPSFPPQLLMLSLRKLSPFPLNIRLSVKEVTLDQAKKALQERSADLAISTQVPFGFVGKKLIEIEHVAVAHPEHPLFALKREISIDDLENQFQITISCPKDYVPADVNYRLQRYSRVWNVSSFDTAICALRYALGYAWLPRYRVQQYLDGNHIRILPLMSGCIYKTNLYIIFGRSVGSDSGVKRFSDALQSCSELPF